MRPHLLVATNGSPAAAGALRLALALSRKKGSQVDVLTVLERPSVPHFTGSSGLPVDYPAADPSALEAMQDAARLQVRSLGDDASHWPIIPAYGSLGTEIARVAKDRDAELILLGVKPRTALERFSTDAALDVLHVAHVPIIAALPGVMNLPRSALVGVDFTNLSIDAAEAVVPLLADRGTIHLAHVLPPVPTPGDGAPPQHAPDPVAARIRLERVASELAPRAHVSVSVHVFKGEPDEALIQLADQLRVDLIATGSHGYADTRRALMRSVSTALLRSAPCSVLVLPPAAGVAERVSRLRVAHQPNYVDLDPIAV